MLDDKRAAEVPTFAALRQANLSRITGHEGTRLLRLRYQPEARAILHVALGTGADALEGSIWFYAGRKAESLAGKLQHARFDPATGALFQTFPHDHRLPDLASFVLAANDFATRLLGGAALAAPVLVRYRPGLSATFRWTRADGAVFFVKHTVETEVANQAQTLRNLADETRGRGLGFSAVAGIVPELGLIAYAAVPGVPLSEAPCDRDVTQVLGALRTLWSLPVVPERMLDRQALLARASRAQRMIAFFDKKAGHLAADLVARLEDWRVPVRMRPIHADMKLEHAILSGRETCLIDMDSLALGDPNYDLASLEARITLARLLGQMHQPAAEGAIHLVRQQASPDYLWFLTCARLKCATFLATRLVPEMIPVLRRMLADN